MVKVTAQKYTTLFLVYIETPYRKMYFQKLRHKNLGLKATCLHSQMYPSQVWCYQGMCSAHMQTLLHLYRCAYTPIHNFQKMEHLPVLGSLQNLIFWLTSLAELKGSKYEILRAFHSTANQLYHTDTETIDLLLFRPPSEEGNEKL